MKKSFFFVVLACSPFLILCQWKPFNLNDLEITSLDVSDSHIYVGKTGGLAISDNFGDSWSYSAFSPAIYNVNTVARVGDTLLVGTDNGMIRSIDNGSNWNSVFAFVNFPVYSIHSTGQGVYSSSNAGVHFSNNSGESWTNISNGLPELSPTYKLTSNGTHVFALADSMVYSMVINSNQWNAANNGLEGNPVHDLMVSGSTVYAGTSQGDFYSYNNGELWLEMNFGLPGTAVHSLASAGSMILAATNNGVFIADEIEGSWTSVNAGLPNVNARFVDVCGTKAIVALAEQTASGELWSRQLQDIVGIENATDAILFSMYPNPSHGKFKIENGKAGVSCIDVFAPTGVRVLSVFNTKRDKVLETDLRAFESGIYFVMITDNENNVFSRKLLLE